MSATRRLSCCVVAALGLSIAGAGLHAETTEVRSTLPVPASIDLAERSSILALPFVAVSQEGEGRLPGLDATAELGRYLEKVLRRETDLRLVEARRVGLPSRDLKLLARDRDFWRALGERSGADLIIAGSIDFDVQERSGYVTEEVPTLDGRPYYRQVLIEQTGFELDLLVMVFDGRSGELLVEDNFKDFQRFDDQGADPLRGLFANLVSLERRLVGLFQRRQVEVTRLLLAG